MQIGIEQHSKKILEGASSHGWEMKATPFLSPCSIYYGHKEPFKGPGMQDAFGHKLFREDYFDPISRIRRGRLYGPQGGQPHDWFLPKKIDGQFKKLSADTYFSYSLYQKLKEHGINNTFLVMGDERRFTVWKLISYEVISTGEELLTLKSINNMGLVPQIIDSENKNIQKLSNLINKVCDAADRDSPESVIDLCRDAATLSIGIYLDKLQIDLGNLLKELELASDKNRRELALYSGKIINRLHPRRKPNEVEKHNLRLPSDEDSKLAINCLGTILVELGQARY